MNAKSVSVISSWDGKDWQPIGEWLTPVVGLQDDPYERQQTPLQIDLDNGGHLAVYGVPGSGKTTFLHTLLISLARMHTPAEINMYLLDFNSQSLRNFEELPHVGNVVLEGDDERIDRLFKYLKQEMDRRKEILLNAGAGTNFSHYRELTKEVNDNLESLPAIILICDGYPALAENYEHAKDVIVDLTAEGRSVGIHLALTANNPMNIRMRVSNNIRLAVAFEMADRGDYSAVVGRTDGLYPKPIAGRGLVKRLGERPLEFQTALPILGDTEPDRIAALRNLISQMANSWGERKAAYSVPVLPKIQPLVELLRDESLLARYQESQSVPVGLNVGDLSPFTINLIQDGPHALIVGDIQTGKTNFLQTWLLAFATVIPQELAQVYLCDLGYDEDGLLSLQGDNRTAHFTFIDSSDVLNQALQEVSNTLSERREQLEQARNERGKDFNRKAFVTKQPAIILAIDNYDGFQRRATMDINDTLSRILEEGSGLGLHVLLAGTERALGGYSSEEWVQEIKLLQTGFVLASGQSDILNLYTSSVPSGQGYFIRRNRAQRVQIAVPTS